MDAPIYHLEKVVKARSEDLEDFTGPLDLILALLSKNKMEIQDIQISVILDQYLAWMEQRKRLDLEVASDLWLWPPSWSSSSPECSSLSTTKRPSLRWNSSSPPWRPTSAMRTI